MVLRGVSCSGLAVVLFSSLSGCIINVDIWMDFCVDDWSSLREKVLVFFY